MTFASSNIPPASPLAYEGQVVIPYINKTFAPTSSNNQFPVPTIWTDTSSSDAYILTSKPGGVADWQLFTGGSGSVITIDADSGSASPVAGIIISSGGSTGMTTLGSGNTVTIVGTLNVGHGGLGVTTIPADGQIPIGNGTDYTVANLVSSDGTVTITNGSGTINLQVPKDLHAARFIVSAGGSADGANYTTIATAYAAAVAAGAPQTVFIQDGVYTENITGAAGINLSSFSSNGIQSVQGTVNTPNVVIQGTFTASYNGTVNISGIQLKTNGAAAIAFTGSSSTQLNLINCSVYANNATGITLNNSTCVLNCISSTFASTSTNQLFVETSSSGIDFENCVFSLSATAVASSLSLARALFEGCDMEGLNLSTSGSGSVFVNGCTWGFGGQVLLTTAGTGTSEIHATNLKSGSASSVSVGTGTFVKMTNSSVDSSNTNALTGAGTLIYGCVVFVNSSTVNVTTQTGLPLSVIQGGTKNTSFTAYAPIVGGTTTTGAFQSADTAIGNSGFVLTSTGASSIPTWQANGTGNVAGPGSSTDRAIATWNGTGGTALFNNSTTNIDSTGRQTNTAQPCFLYTLNSVVANVTGTGTVYTLGSTALTKVYDNGSNMTTGGTFTAPVTGRYLFAASCLMTGGTTITEGRLKFNATSGTYNCSSETPAGTAIAISGSIVLQMTAADTLTFQVYAFGQATDAVSINGAASQFNTWVSGCLLC